MYFESLERNLYHKYFNKPFLSDYVGFIKKIMKLMQIQYPMLAKVEVEMTQEKEMDELPNRPSKFCSSTYLLDCNLFIHFLYLIYLARAGALLYQVEKGKVNGRGGD